MGYKKLKIAHLTAEVSPYSKVGGLGDVGYALPKAIARLGHEVVVISPYYGLVRQKKIQKEVIDNHEHILVANTEYPVSFRKHISPDGLPIYFVVNEELFGSHSGIYDEKADDALRWIFFTKASLLLLKTINFQPDIIHTHDRHAALASNYLKTEYQKDAFYENCATVYTIHNITHQGSPQLKDTPKNLLDKGTGAPPENKSYRNYINFVKRGILFSNVISTVSVRYAKELITPEFGGELSQFLRRRQDRLFGIINGIDYEVVNPAFDKNIYVNYDLQDLTKKMQNKKALQKEVGLEENETIPLIGVVNRLSEQKGFNLIIEAMPCLLQLPLQLVVVGSTFRKDYLDFFREQAHKNPTKVGFYTPFSEKMASRVYAGSDIYLMPSLYEPCGLSQLISLRYGSIPIVRSVGGLYDTVTDFDPNENSGNGFVFQEYSSAQLLVAIARATEEYKHHDTWNKLVSRAMKQSFSWELPAKKYVELYRVALKIKNQG